MQAQATGPREAHSSRHVHDHNQKTTARAGKAGSPYSLPAYGDTRGRRGRGAPRWRARRAHVAQPNHDLK